MEIKTPAQQLIVGISDYKIIEKPHSLITYALGSCVGICLRDTITGTIGLAHILLPDSRVCSGRIDRKKYADTAIIDMISELNRLGVTRYRLTAKIAGGARLFGGQNTINIGERNIASVRQILIQEQIRLVSEDVGKDYGRTIEFLSMTGELLVKSVKHRQTMII